MSQIEWKTIKIGASKDGTFSPFPPRSATLAENAAAVTEGVEKRSLSDAVPSKAMDRRQSSEGEHIPMPEIPHDFPEIFDALDDAGIAALAAGDEGALVAAVDGIPVLASMRSLRDDLRAQNLAAALRAREEARAADGARADCAAARERLAQALAAYDAKKAAADAHVSVDPVADARDRAKRLAAAADERSCDVASDYASGACDTKQFIERYLEARKAYHLETSLAAACERPGTGLPVVDI